jgi:hypothetical protein
VAAGHWLVSAMASSDEARSPFETCLAALMPASCNKRPSATVKTGLSPRRVAYEGNAQRRFALGRGIDYDRAID